MEQNDANLEKEIIESFLLEVGLKSDREIIRYAKIMERIENKEEKIFHNLNVLGSELGPLKVIKLNKFRSFNDQKLDENYKTLMNKAGVLFRDKGYVIHKEWFSYDQDSIEKLDEILGILSNDWVLQKAFASKKKLNKKIADIVRSEFKKNMGALLKGIIIQGRIHIKKYETLKN